MERKVLFRMPEDLVKSLDEKASALGMSRNEFVIWFFRFALRTEDQPIGQVLDAFTKDVADRRKKLNEELGIKT